MAAEVIAVGDLRVVLGVHHGGLARRGPVRRHQRPVVVGVRGVEDLQGPVPRVVGLVPRIGREEVPVRAGRPVAGGVVEDGEVVGRARLAVEAGQALDVALDPDAGAPLAPVVLAEDAAGLRVHPMEPALEGTPGLHAIEVATGGGIDEEVGDGLAAAEVARRDLAGLGLGQAHGVDGDDSEAALADDRDLIGFGSLSLTFHERVPLGTTETLPPTSTDS